MKREMDCEEARDYLQDCLDRGEFPQVRGELSDRVRAHLTECPDCRAWQETLAGAAAGLQGALTARIEAVPPLRPAALEARIRAGRLRRRRRRLAGIAAALIMAIGLSVTAAGILSRRRSPALTEAGGDYLLEVLFTDSLLLESSYSGLVLEGNGGWLADTLESTEIYNMEPLTIF